MLDSIKRWLGTAAPDTQGFGEQAAWAQSRQAILRGVRELDGFVVDGRSGATAWRLEWGPSQRPYIQGQELRIRAELSVPRELQALVLNRELMESMEKTVFEQYVEGVQTRIDTTTPPEMRWLVMFPKLSNAELKGLRDSYGALCSFKPWMQQWLAGGLATALGALPGQGAQQPRVLMIARRRLSLRAALPEADVASLQAWLQLFEAALREAQRVAIDYLEQGTPSTQPSMFPASTLPAEPQRR